MEVGRRTIQNFIFPLFHLRKTIIVKPTKKKHFLKSLVGQDIHVSRLLSTLHSIQSYEHMQYAHKLP